MYDRTEAEERAEKRIQELEFKVLYRESQLEDERERNERAKKKVKQLLAKLEQRDKGIAELKDALEKAMGSLTERRESEDAAAASRPARVSPSSSGRRHTTPKGASASSSAAQRSNNAGRSQEGAADRASRERAAIVAKLEGHLTQMRVSLVDSEREVKELEERRRAKEQEWKNSSEAVKIDRGNTKVHWQALSIIAQQIQDKRRFASELAGKARELEEQVAQQRALLNGAAFGGGVGAAKADSPTAASSAAQQRGEEADQMSGEAMLQELPEDCDEALQAFLAAAGPLAATILGSAALRSAFEEQPPRLGADALEGCSGEARVQVISLFVAWAAVAGEPPHAVHLEEISLEAVEVEELATTLQSCGAQLEEWEMTRCSANDVTIRSMFEALATQPLRRLNLGYNALGAMGTGALLGAAPSWAVTLETLSLEMNGLGDSVCQDVATALHRGLLPCLRTLELGWNELSASCAPSLARLLEQPHKAPGAAGAADESEDEDEEISIVCQLHRLGLGGNRLGSEGATSLVMASLKQPGQSLELDLSMNHVGVEPISAVAEWVESCAEGLEVLVSINLEWNIIDDAKAVQRLVDAAGSKQLDLAGDTWGSSRPMIQLANNELVDLEPSLVSQQSRGFVAC